MKNMNIFIKPNFSERLAMFFMASTMFTSYLFERTRYIVWTKEADLQIAFFLSFLWPIVIWIALQYLTFLIKLKSSG